MMVQNIADLTRRGAIRFAGGDGSPGGRPIVIEGPESEIEGTAAEDFYIGQRHPLRDWATREQVSACDDTSCYDTVTVTLKGGEAVSFVFDVRVQSPPEPHEHPPSIDLGVVSRDGVLYFSVAEAFSRVVCHRYEEQVWEARCPNGPACLGAFVYGDPTLLTNVGPLPLRQGAFACNVFRTEDWEEGSGTVSFCLNGRAEIGACRRD